MSSVAERAESREQLDERIRRYERAEREALLVRNYRAAREAVEGRDEVRQAYARLSRRTA